MEDDYQCKISCHHKVFTWLVPHAADLLTTYIRGPDGKTGYERIKSKKYKGEMLKIGSGVYYRIPISPPEGGV